MPTFNKSLAIASAFAGGLFIAAQAAAVPVIIQGVGDDHLAWEAEIGAITDPDADLNTWRVLADGSASGGSALVADAEPGSGDKALDEGIVSYNLKFNTIGEYQLYLLFKTATISDGIGLDNATGPNDNDSMFIPDKNDNDGFGVIPDISSGGATGSGTSSYMWVSTGSTGRYTVTGGDLGNNLGFSFGVREEGFVLDRVVLFNRSVATSRTADQLNALANSEIPAPASLLLLGTGMLALAGALARRRRRAA